MVLRDGMKKKITIVQMRSHECIGESHGGLKTEEFPYLPNSIQPMECLTVDIANTDGHLGVTPAAQVAKKVCRGWIVESPTEIQSIEIFDN